MSVPLHLLARHGQTAANVQGVFRSRLDVPLDSKGVDEAHEAAEYVAKRFPVNAIITSPMQRAQHTAQIYGQHLGIQPQVDARLAPWDAGMLTGMKRDRKTEAIRDYYIQNPETRIPKGESISESEGRIRDILMAAMQHPGHVLMVTHGSGIKAADTVLSGHREPTGDSALVAPGGIAGVFQSPRGYELRPIFKEEEQGKVAS